MIAVQLFDLTVCDMCEEENRAGVALIYKRDDTEHEVHICADCLAQLLEAVTGFRFTSQLAAWRTISEYSRTRRAERALRRALRKAEAK